MGEVSWVHRQQLDRYLRIVPAALEAQRTGASGEKGQAVQVI